MHDLQRVQDIFDKAVGVALDERAVVGQRREAVTLLANAPYPLLMKSATQLLDARQPPSLQSAAIAALSAADDPDVAQVLLFGWKGYTPNARKGVLDAVFAKNDRLPTLLDAVENQTVRPAELNDIYREQLTRHPDTTIAARAERLLGPKSSDAEMLARIERYERALSGNRDLQRGREVFTKHCMACHQVQNEGEQVGPPLAASMNRTDEALLADLLDPSRQVASGYQSYVVITQGGRIYNGVLESDSATSISLKREKGERIEILRKDIESVTASELSMMPSNLHQQITPQDAAHLLAWLRNTLTAERNNE
jgi:putative heme-binding domain-containing protein